MYQEEATEYVVCNNTKIYRLPYWDLIERFYNDCMVLEPKGYIFLEDIGKLWKNYWLWKERPEVVDVHGTNQLEWLRDKLNKYYFWHHSYITEIANAEALTESDWDGVHYPDKCKVILGLTYILPEGMPEIEGHELFIG